MVISTNVAAQQTADYLSASTQALSKSLARLSSGSKIIAPSDDAAGLAVTTRLAAQVQRIDAALNNVTNAVSFIQTQDGFMRTVDKAFRRMGELALLAQDNTKAAADRDLYNEEFKQLQAYVSSTASKDFNGVSLFSATAFDVTVDQNGSTFAMPGVNLATASYADALNNSATYANISTTTAAIAALNKVKDAISQIAIDRAKLGAVQSRLNFTSEQLITSKENLNQADSRIKDMDVAEESTRYAKYQILVQSGTSMLGQANTMPQSALRLLQ
jgi:flagellin